MRSWRAATIAVIVTLTFLVIAYDTIALWRGGGAATISDVILSAARRRPIIAVAVGILIGHLFFPQIVGEAPTP